ETSLEGVFACGNVVHIHDLVDYVTEEGLLAGRCAAAYALGRPWPRDNIRLVPGRNVRYCVPHSISSEREHTLYMRVRQPMERPVLRLGDVYEKRLRYVVPGEMVRVTVRPSVLEAFHGDNLLIEVVERGEA